MPRAPNEKCFLWAVFQPNSLALFLALLSPPASNMGPNCVTYKIIGPKRREYMPHELYGLI
ncbi:hypothetical protein AAHE18_19G258900 [Arachis hypogaea]